MDETKLTWWGRAWRPSRDPHTASTPEDPAILVVRASAVAVYCRNCERTVPAGDPFTRGALGCYCRDCLNREGWELVEGFSGVELEVE